MVDIVRQAVIWFVSSLVCATGARCGRYIAERLTETRPSGDQPASDHRSHVLCQRCGKPMRRQPRALSCPDCGHREG